MTKNKNKIVMIIALAVVALIFISSPGTISEKFKDLTRDDPASSDDDFMKVRMYDEAGNIINDDGTFSVVQGVPGVSFIDISVNVNHVSGTIPLTCNLHSLSPVAFNSVLTPDLRVVPVGGKTTWTSDLIATDPLEISSPVTFSATASCSYASGSQTISLSDLIGEIILTIDADPSAPSFDVSVSGGGLADEFCGDGICQADEDSQTCPQDCAVFNNVNFRATELSYTSGSAIGYISSCGNVLEDYGYSTKFSSYTSDCLNTMNQKVTGCGTATRLLANIPGGWLSGSTGVELWDCSGKIGDVYACDTEGGTKSVVKRYRDGDADEGKVDTTPISFDPNKEKIC